MGDLGEGVVGEVTRKGTLACILGQMGFGHSDGERSGLWGLDASKLVTVRAEVRLFVVLKFGRCRFLEAPEMILSKRRKSATVSN